MPDFCGEGGKHEAGGLDEDSKGHHQSCPEFIRKSPSEDSKDREEPRPKGSDEGDLGGRDFGEDLQILAEVDSEGVRHP